MILKQFLKINLFAICLFLGTNSHAITLTELLQDTIDSKSISLICKKENGDEEKKFTLFVEGDLLAGTTVRELLLSPFAGSFVLNAGWIVDYYQENYSVKRGQLEAVTFSKINSNTTTYFKITDSPLKLMRTDKTSSSFGSQGAAKISTQTYDHCTVVNI